MTILFKYLVGKNVFALTLLLIVTIPTASGQTCNLRVEMPRHTVEVLAGESETLECEYFAEGSCNIDYLEWCISRGTECTSLVHITDSGPSWFNDYGDYYSNDGNNLVIDEAETLHEGEYICIVEDWNGNTGQEILNLFVLAPFAPINIFTSVDKLPVIEGNDVLLTCTANGVPTPTYDWTQNGVELSDRNKYQINEDGSELTILSITKHEREYYNCTATNQKGSDSTAAFIDVYYEPQTGWPLCEVHVETNENYIAEGDLVELICKATSGNPPPHLELYNNSEALPECTSTTDDNGVVSEIVSCWILTPYDNGKMYECKGNHDATEETPNCFTDVFDVKYSPTWQTCNQTAGDQFQEEDDFTLTCVSDGHPLATLQWINETDSAILRETNGYDDGETAINEYSWELTRGDNQVFFECHAFNNIRENTLECRTALLTVHFAPLYVWLTGYTDTARKGDRLELSCVTDSSNPVSTISWYKNDQLITDDDHEEIQEEDIRDGSFHGKVTEGGLHFDVLASHNENEFSCKTTRLGYGEVDFTVSVTANVYFPPSEPDGCTSSLTGYSAPVLEGENLVLTCTSCSGNPTPIIEWFEDENKIKSGFGDISNSHGNYRGKISLQDLTLDLTYQHHGQMLRCESFNEEFTQQKDRVISNAIILDVYYSPFVKNEEKHQHLVVILAENADLLCEINSNPDVEIIWYDNNNETICNGTGKFLVRKTTADTITTGVLTIFNVSESDLGDYRCHAVNVINEVNFTIRLSTKGSPDPATELEVIDRREDNLTVQWTAGNDGGSKQVFHLEYIQQNMAAMLETQGICDPFGETTNVTTETHGTITDLTPMTSYFIIVVSRNDIGCTRSHPIVDSTLPKMPLKAEDIKFNQYTGELLIIAPVGSCIKIDKMRSNDKWISLTFHTANGTCDDNVIYTIEDSAFLRIYFCTDDYTDCGEPYETEFYVKGKANTGAIIGISLTAALLFAAICVGIFVYVRRRNSKDMEDNVGPLYENPNTVALDDIMDFASPKDNTGTDVHNDGAYADLQQTKTEYMGLVFKNRKQGMLESNDDTETTNESLQLYAECDLKSPPASSDLVFGDTIIDGVFTKLVEAKLQMTSQRALAVSVKILKDPNDTEGKQALWREARFMKSLTDNPNIVSCLKELTTEDPVRLVLEHCHYGNLKSYLRKLDHQATEMRDLLLFSLDSVKGMCFLEEIQCVHRQLATRVVMLDGQKTCKISELGFSTAVMDQETYERMNKRTLPIRWMALESIDECMYTSASDVWSYGILLWEIFSFGFNPYRGMNLKEVVSNVKQGYRLPMPNNCPEDVYSIMQKCWQREPSDRPTFHDLVGLLEKLSDISTAGVQRPV